MTSSLNPYSVLKGSGWPGRWFLGRPDPRPREAIKAGPAWTRGELKMMQARAAGGHGMGAARDLHGAAPARRLRGRQGRGGCARRHAQARRGRLCDQGRPVPPRRTARTRRQGAWSAGGGVTSSRRRFASSSLTTSGCGTTSAGRCSTARPDAIGALSGDVIVTGRGGPLGTGEPQGEQHGDIRCLMAGMANAGERRLTISRVSPSVRSPAKTLAIC